MDHTTASELTGGIERAYAHFHRVLGTLLSDLSSKAHVLWLEQEGHIIRPDYEHNEYRPAIYTVPELAPWQEQLSELDRVQADILEQTGRDKPGKNLLPPLVANGVHYIRVSRYQGQTGRNVSRQQVTTRLEQLINTARQNLSAFENYATRDDPARKQVESEVRSASETLELIQQSAVEQFRETYQQTVIRPYVYFLDGSSTQMHLRSQGLLAAGPHVETGWRQGPRKTRSDKITLPALAAVGNYAFYDLDAWEAARDSR